MSGGTVIEQVFYAKGAEHMAAAQKKDTQQKRTGKADGEERLRRNGMMAHLMDALEQGQDIGHYGRLVFAMVGHHFLDDDALVGWLQKDRDFDEQDARALVLQVKGRDYNPPKRTKILEWQRQQDFPIIPNPDDPDEGNVYKDLDFPDGVYDSISEYYEEKAEAQEETGSRAAA
jgi:hypothetical protein